MIITNKVKTRYSYFGFDDIFDTLHQLEETFKKEKETEKLPAILDNFYGITSEIIEELKELDQYKNIKSTMTSALPLEGKRILVAEDDSVNAMVFEIFITELGAEVIIARDGFEAIGKTLELNPDFIFMDVHMSYCNGLNAIKSLRGKGIKTPIISLSASVHLNEREESMLAGGTDFLSKPADREAIRQVLLTHLM